MTDLVYIVRVADARGVHHRVVVTAATERHAKGRGRSAAIRAGVAADPRAIDAEPLGDRAVIVAPSRTRTPSAVVDMRGS